MARIRSNSWVIKKIRDSSFCDILDPIENDASLVFQPNPRGWTCLHIACTSTIPQNWWEWLLQQATGDHTKLLTSRTDNGQTPLDLYFRTSLFPLPWQDRQIQQEAEVLKKAIQGVLHSPRSVNELRLHIQGTNKIWDTRDDEDQILKIVFQFWQRMESLLSVAYYGGMDAKYRIQLRTEVILALANLPWCPQPVADLAIELFPYPDSITGPNPLHLWASAKSMYKCHQRPDPGVIRVLCLTYPGAASRTSSVGRFPLHMALSMGKCWTEIEPLFDAFPDAVYYMDAVSRLPIFCLPTVVPIDEYEVEMVGKRRGDQASIWYYISQRDRNRALDRAREIIECQRIDTMYQLLRRNPSALSFRCREFCRN